MAQNTQQNFKSKRSARAKAAVKQAVFDVPQFVAAIVLPLLLLVVGLFGAVRFG